MKNKLVFLLFLVFACQKTSDIHHVKVYFEEGRFGGWPANHGIWSWGDEILVGFSRGYHKDLGPERHNIDREKPEEHIRYVLESVTPLDVESGIFLDEQDTVSQKISETEKNIKLINF